MEEIEKFIKKLNKEQKLAVETIEGPVLIIAGPGTGKTQMLAVRIANILQKTDANPNNILCLTFTETGVVAMRKRLLQIIGTAAYQVKIHTFHSFCNEVIQEYSEKFAFTKDLIQIDDLTRIKLTNEVIDSFEGDKRIKNLRPFHNPYSYRNAIISSFQSIKREGFDSFKFASLARENYSEIESNPEVGVRSKKPTEAWKGKLKNAEKVVELSLFYEKYQELLKERGLYDYEDMLMFVVEKFKIDEELLSSYQERFLYILVDEYQDTNGVQNNILKYLGSFDQSPNIFAVGDDDQAIYRFQGANLENLLFFSKQFKNVKPILVTTNYRSSQNILDLADSLIRNNKTRLASISEDLQKKLKAGINKKNHNGELSKFSHGEKENHFIVKKIKEIKNNGSNYSDIAIFYRQHKHAEDLIEVLLKEGIPINLATGVNALDNTLIKQFVELLKLILFKDVDFENKISKALFFPFLKLNRVDAIKILNFINRESLIYKDSSGLVTFNLLNNEGILKKIGVSSINDFLNFGDLLIKWRAAIEDRNLYESVEEIGNESGLLKYIYEQEDKVENINAINSFYRYIRAVQKADPKLSIEQLLADIETMNEVGISIEQKSIEMDRDAVNLMTAHRAKGLEYKHVFIIKCVENVWGKTKGGSNNIKLPTFSKNVESILGDDIDFEIEDQRRLFFVAITRAEERIYFTLSDEYTDGNASKKAVPSQFLNELDQSLIEKVDTSEFESLDINDVIKQLTPLSKRSINEDEYLKEIIKNFRLSASALNDYIECPLKFKFNRLLHIPSSFSKSLVLGNGTHKALETFFRELMKGEQKEKDFLLFQFEKAIKSQIIPKSEFDSILNEGTKILSEYFDNYNGKFITPISLEYKFSGPNVLLINERTEPIQLTGRIDKIEKSDLGENNSGSTKIKVVDYKSSTPKTVNHIKGLTQDSNGSIYRQLLFYKILGDSDNDFRPAFNKSKYEVSELEIDYLKPEKGRFKKISFFVDDEDVQKLKDQIIEIMIRIRNLEFSGSEEFPLCGKCEWCELK